MVCLAIFAQLTYAQSNLVDIEVLKANFASAQGIKVTDIKSASFLTFGNQHFGYFKYTKEGRSNTTAQEYTLGGSNRIIPAGATLTCTGVGCAECDIEGLPNVMKAYCDCKRIVAEGGYCNMIKSITGGGR